MTDQPVALVTAGGGAIGAAYARHLAARGYHPVIADLDPDAATAVAHTVGGTAHTLDVSDRDANLALIDTILDRHGRLDLLCLHAGVATGQRATEPLDLPRYRRAVSVNIDGVVYGIDAALPALSVRGGHIIVTSTLAAIDPSRANPLYTLTKSAVLGFVRALANPLQPRHITINALCPGFVDTPMLDALRPTLAEQGYPLITPDDVATAMDHVIDTGTTGGAWALIPGQPPLRYDYPPLPPSLMPDGSPAPELRLPPPLMPTGTPQPRG
ncbi:SDR family NAD(P)-dependent oxidoreductase [Catellatospora sp. KI3]|uniref:SDR family oxidoreductase n=1 Tax=Catellatospora sp. KI3 TaxID=3041620 RepID=UPI0024828F66|nr:SDR family NAD(P)-dependent oxidoreductase [Catellatospora sp. KI3]MDI1463677.1 SDR family NAD(P)-dependent oxidoreductase [Catellatospora sp. KI3]